ncbi:MAG: LysE family translocator [Marinibacterium sp.]|nr:LysE family translocator [Marinibacterium sp.]
MTWTLWLSFAAISALNIVTPGPANLNTVQRALQLGAWRVGPTILGNALGLAIGGMACASGVVALMQASDLIWIGFRVLGVLYLAWLGLRLLRPGAAITATAGETIPARQLFAEALALAVTNPKALLFYIALLPQGIDPQGAVLAQAALLVATYCGLSILSLSTYAGLADLARGWLLSPARYRRFRQICGVLLLAMALALGLRV